MEDKKCACGMPLTKETTCTCNPELCIHCCECDEDCECGCADLAEAEVESCGEDKCGGKCNCSSKSDE